MFRNGLLAVAALLIVCGAVADAQAQSPVSFGISALYGVRTADVSVSLADNPLWSVEENVQAFGAEVSLGLPIGVHVAAHYLRHFKDLEEVSASSLSLGANEIGANVEKRVSLAPASPISPYVGAGVGYARVSFGDELVLSTDVNTSLADLNLWDFYGTFGMSLGGVIGAQLRVGYSTGDMTIEEDTPLGAVSGGMDYSGTFFTVAASLGF